MMALLFNLKNSMKNLLKIKQINYWDKSISSTSLLLFNQRLGRSSSFKEIEKRLLEKDKVSQNYCLIYKAPMQSYVLWAMNVSTATTALIGTAAIYQYIENTPILDSFSMALSIEYADIYYFSAGFLAINALLRLVVSRFPLRIYRDQEKYIAVYHPQLHVGISHHHFKRGQVKAAYYRLSPWNNATYKLGGKTSLLLEDYFKTPSEFHEMRDMDLNR